MTSDRFAKLWETWDTHQGPDEVLRFLQDAKDEELIELLAGESARNRKYERDVIATQILNRLHKRHNDFPAGAQSVLRSAEAAQLAAESGQAAIHASETLLHEAGEHELGQSISESAYESLDATKGALQAARRHAANVQESLAQSRQGQPEKARKSRAEAQKSAEAAAEAAQRGSALTEGLEKHMRATGNPREGKAAAEAGEAISEAADAAAKAAARLVDATRKDPET